MDEMHAQHLRWSYITIIPQLIIRFIELQMLAYFAITLLSHYVEERVIAVDNIILNAITWE